MDSDIMNVISDIVPEFYRCEKIVEGHINRTFKIYTQKETYILQYINKSVFFNIDDVMNNISIVCEHLKKCNIPVLDYLTTKQGKNYDITPQGEYIRVCKYLDNSICLNYSNDLKTIYNIGSGFGEFSYNLSSIDGSKIVDTIENFHNTEYYLKRVLDFKEVSVKADKILSDIYTLRDYSKVTQSMDKQVTHNDVKMTNILLNKDTHERLCVIDLDTIMNGYVYYDFADGVRSICKSKDYPLIDINKFKAYSQGFLRYPVGITDKSLSIDSIVAVSLELSSRYLYEYLINGNYFNLSSMEEYLKKAKFNLDFAKDVLSKKMILLKSD